MANELVKMKTGTIAKLEHETNGAPDVPLDAGTVYFAVDTDVHKGKIVYDAPVGANGVDRIVMSTDAERADYATTAGTAASATQASSLVVSRSIDGVSFNGTADVMHYATCSTVAATATKAVTCSNFSLATGAKLTITWGVTNTASNPTLSVNGGTAKAIYYHGEVVSPDILEKDETHEFVYDGTHWNLVGTVAKNVIITIDDDEKTLFITSPIINGDGVSY